MQLTNLSKIYILLWAQTLYMSVFPWLDVSNTGYLVITAALFAEEGVK